VITATTRAAAGCAVCGSAALAPHLTVRVDGDPTTLAADTTAYGHATSDIARCAECGHMQLETMPDEPSLEDAYSDESEAAYVEEERGQRATAARALERIERHVPPGALCDLGCWVGFLLAEARDRGWETLGVEPSRFASAYARERLGLDVRTGTLDDAELPAAAFDAVVMGDVIEHLPDPAAGLERVAALLRPGGVLYLALPDAGSRLARALGARWWSVLPTHVHYFTRASLARLLDGAGFSVEWMGTAPKAFSVEYYAGRLAGYSQALARAATGTLRAARLSDRIVCPDFRDRMAVVARVR
jgi:SAM-dependent methyltransferase